VEALIISHAEVPGRPPVADAELVDKVILASCCHSIP